MLSDDSSEFFQITLFWLGPPRKIHQNETVLLTIIELRENNKPTKTIKLQ